MRRSLPSAALAAAVSVSAVAVAHAAAPPMIVHSPVAASATVDTVQYRPYWHHHYWHRRYWHHRRWCYYHPGACY